ncbi:aldehyde dehydrogenase family protein [Streptomyces albireticuli]|uniref:Aldehyde dehydrogenase n=1 Tax=Streptomyces albireticuli TaxID=1940 RepID=A0A2A2D2P5_9ACTN|nr:aldehyde dehydrogenase family protein [Streptomyces albireticuli]MCD9141428.1 aldehyde dehydrogenase family protein [Streptomyces albireticuli]MCD9160611.1 aldehyde dehydrogenase family protein [Streptomyces albireticuli]MCD9195833.1 aldehyde dehydrogenase family protein [Streptomyces albireticuli]PAU45679.1 aldehyde dehydrogenase [Streptomyces albireticuli]
MTAAPNLVASRNPADPSDTVCDVPAHGASGAAEAVERARAAQPGWLLAGAAARSSALSAVAAAIEAAAAELAALAVREAGKPLAEAQAEVTRTAAIWRYYAQAPYEPTGAVHETAGGPGLLLTRRRPHGVAGLVTPWNFPFAIPSWKAAPALAAGNTVVLKPAPEATACALRLAELVQGAVPDAVFTVVPGGAAEGHAVVATADVVSFTGSTAVGEAVTRAATARGVPVQAETGGLNAAIVLPDADIGRAAAHIAAAIAGYAGQKCTATSRVIAVGAALDPLREALAEALRALPVGDPADPATVCGPLISGPARDRFDASLSGAPVLATGTAPDGPGWYAAPTVVEKAPAGHRLLTEEVFAPVAALLPADDLAHAVRIGNSVPYGLVTSVHTGGIEAVLNGLDGLDTGMIRVNAPSTGVDFHLPFGGTKASGHGPREQGRAALDFYTSSRTYTLAP